jgi:hypothetical protein
MKIIDRLPISEEGWKVPTPDGVEEVRPYQIIVRVSITAGDVQECPGDAPVIPAILDTGNNHNFAIRQEHRNRWIDWAPRRVGQIHVGGFIVPLFAAKVWIHSNREGTVDLSGGIPCVLKMDPGIAIYPSTTTNPARLPILGLRGLIRNGIKVTLEGVNRALTLESPTT